MKSFALLCLAACSGAPFIALEDRAPIEAPDAAPDAAPLPDHVSPTPEASVPDVDDARAPDTGTPGMDASDAGADAIPEDTGVLDEPDAGCPVHTNGAGQTFVDCTPLGTYTVALARHAAAVWFPNVVLPGAEYCCTPACVDLCLVKDIGTNCGVWGYAGNAQGHMTVTTQSCTAPWPDPTADAGYPGWE